MRLPFNQDGRNQQLVAEHPLIGNVSGVSTIFGKIPEERAHDAGAAFVRLTLIGIHIRSQAITQLDRRLGVCFSLRAINPWLAVLIEVSMHSHDGNKSREFHPAGIVFSTGVSPEAAGIHAPVWLAKIDR